MSAPGESAVLGLLIAGSLAAGAFIAVRVKLPERIAGTIAAFGGGILLASVALELVPAAGEHAGPWPSAIAIGAGALLFVGADAWLTRTDERRAMRRAAHAAGAGMSMDMPESDATRGESIAAGIFVDGVPESLALGLTIAQGALGRALLAGVLIGNLVEAYGSAQPIIAAGRGPRFALVLLAGIGVALGMAAFLGGATLSGASPSFVGAAEAVAAGAVLAVVSISIIPYAFEQVSRRVALAVVAGF